MQLVLLKVRLIILLSDRRSRVRNVTVIRNEECVPKHKLFIMDMRFNTTKSWCKKFELRVHVWKLRKKRRQEYQSMVKDKVAKAE